MRGARGRRARGGFAFALVLASALDAVSGLASEADLGLRAPACELTRLVAADSPTASPALSSPLPSASFSSESFVRSFEGRVTLVDFWASWCPTCDHAFGYLNALARDYREAGLDVVAVNLDADPQDALAFLARRRVEFEVVRDATGRCPRGFGLVGMPQAFLIDASGRVQAVTRGFRASDARAMRDRIETLLEHAPNALPAVAAGRADPR